MKSNTDLTSVRPGKPGVNVREAVTEEESKGFEPDRIVVFTDEQDNYYDVNNVAVFAPHGYIVNVGTYRKGVLYQTASKWVHISGWSDGVVKFITENEKKNWLLAVTPAEFGRNG